MYGVHGRINMAYQGGTLCVKSNVNMRNIVLQQGKIGTCNNTFSIGLDQLIAHQQTPYWIGRRFNAQYRYDDPALNDPNGFNVALTEGLEFVIIP